MTRAHRNHIPGRVYHVMARGNGGQSIVGEAQDWAGLRDVIALVKRTSDFRLYAYCLMTNHFHLLVRVYNDPLSHIMHRIQTTWAKRFNIARKRRGHVFQDRFKSLACDKDEYFLWLVRYIHMNPVKAGLVIQPEDWSWSSHGEFLHQAEGSLSDYAWPLSLFGDDPAAALRGYQRFILQEANVDSPHPRLLDSRAPSHEDRTTSDRERPTIEAIAREISISHQVNLETLLGHCRVRKVCAARRVLTARAVAAGHRVADLARAFGISTTATSRMLAQPN